MNKNIMAELERDAEDYVNVQEKLMLQILHDNSDTEYGKKHGFNQIQSVSDYQAKVPLTEYEDYKEYIERMVDKGEEGLITAYPIRYYTLSSGTTGEIKKIPLTEKWMDSFEHYAYYCVNELTAKYYADTEVLPEDWNNKIFLLNEVRRTPFIEGTDKLLSSGAIFERRRERGDFDFGRFTSPEDVQFPKYDMDMSYLKLRFGLICEDVTSIESVFIHQITNVMAYLENNWRQLTDDIEAGTINDGIVLPADVRERLEKLLVPMPERASELRKEFETGFDTPIVQRIWKKLRVVVAISGRAFNSYMKRLRRYIGDMPYHYFIYGSSEGFLGAAFGVETDMYMPVPIGGFFEYIPLAEADGDVKNVFDASQVKQGEKYELVFTGYVGLYRYRMGDIVEVAGFYKNMPLLRILYRRKQCMNVAGEKMDIESIAQAVDVFAERYNIQRHEFCVYPDISDLPGRYDVLLEVQEGEVNISQTEANDIMDEQLCRQDMDYDDCRKLGEIGKSKVYFLEEGTFEAYKESLQAKGIETGQFKPIRLLDTQERVDFFFGRVINIE